MKLEGNFTQIPNEFIEDMKNVSPISSIVFIALWKHINTHNDSDEVFPSLTTIQKITGLSRPSVRKAIKELLAIGWIKSIDKGYNSVNHYHLSSKKNLLVKSIAKVVKKKRNRVGKDMNSNNTNITRHNNNTNIENPDFKTSNEVFQSEVGLEDSSIKAENSSVCYPVDDSSPHAEPACTEIKSIGEILDKFIAKDNDKTEPVLINREENENLLPETKNQKRFLEKTFRKEFENIEDKQLFRKIEKHIVEEALIANILISKTFKYEILLTELEEQIPEFFRNR